MLNAKNLSLLSALTNLVLALAKFFIGFLTHSMAIMADALHSSLDVISSLVAYVGIKISGKPADSQHPYGKEKYESLASFIIVLLLFLSAGWILFEAVDNILKKEHIAIFSFWGIGLIALTIVINEIMARLKFTVGNKYSSLALVSDAEHSRADAISSVGVLIGLFFIKFYPLADSILAILVSFYIFYEAYHLSREAIDSLVDKANPELEEKIRKFLEKNNFKFSEIKTRKISANSLAEISLLCDAKAKIEEITLMTEKLEKKLIDYIPNLKQVTIKVKSHKYSRGSIRPGFGRRLRFLDAGQLRAPLEKGQRILIPLIDNKIADKFGVADYLLIEIDSDKKIIKKQKITNPYYDIEAGAHGSKFIKSISADKIIAKHIGDSAKANLKAQKIEIEIVGEDKNIETILSRFK